MQNEAIYDILNQYPEHRDGIPEHYTRDLVEGLGDYLKLVMIDSDKRAEFFKLLSGQEQIEDNTAKSMLKCEIITFSKFLGSLDSPVDLERLTEQSFIDFIKGGILYNAQGVARELSGRHGLGFVQAYSILTKEAHIRHGGMPIRISDSTGHNFALSVVDYQEATPFLDNQAPRHGIQINGCNGHFEKRQVIIFDDGSYQGYNGVRLGAVETQLLTLAQPIQEHFRSNPEAMQILNGTDDTALDSSGSL